MLSLEQPEIPEHLKELIQLTPSGVAKLLSAWDGLSYETQILILSNLAETAETHMTAYLAKKIRIKALDSDNAYVRYLSARTFYFYRDCSDQEKLLKKRIEDDPDPLVKCSMEKYWSLSEQNADQFFALPQEERIAKIRLVGGYGKDIAKILSQVVDKRLKDGTVSESEVFEILVNYLGDPKFQKRYADTRERYYDMGEHEGAIAEEIESLWQLVPVLPENISYLLIENLPEAAGSGTSIPENVVKAMTDEQLCILLNRKDIVLEKLRKNIFWEQGEVKNAAVSSNFQFGYDDFAKILTKSPKEQVSILHDLGIYAQELSLCFYDAIHDVQVALEGLGFAGSAPREELERRIKGLEGEELKQELTELRLYLLARKSVPWDSEWEGCTLKDELDFFSEEMVPGDTWATFMAFSDAWPRRPSEGSNLEKHLPIIAENGEGDWCQEPEIYAEMALSELEKRLDDEIRKPDTKRYDIEAICKEIVRHKDASPNLIRKIFHYINLGAITLYGSFPHKELRSHKNAPFHLLKNRTDYEHIAEILFAGYTPVAPESFSIIHKYLRKGSYHSIDEIRKALTVGFETSLSATDSDGFKSCFKDFRSIIISQSSYLGFMRYAYLTGAADRIVKNMLWDEIHRMSCHLNIRHQLFTTIDELLIGFKPAILFAYRSDYLLDEYDYWRILYAMKWEFLKYEDKISLVEAMGNDGGITVDKIAGQFVSIKAGFLAKTFYPAYYKLKWRMAIGTVWDDVFSHIQSRMSE